MIQCVDTFVLHLSTLRFITKELLGDTSLILQKIIELKNTFEKCIKKNYAV